MMLTLLVTLHWSPLPFSLEDPSSAFFVMKFTDFITWALLSHDFKIGFSLQVPPAGDQLGEMKYPFSSLSSCLIVALAVFYLLCSSFMILHIVSGLWQQDLSLPVLQTRGNGFPLLSINGCFTPLFTAPCDPAHNTIYSPFIKLSSLHEQTKCGI